MNENSAENYNIFVEEQKGYYVIKAVGNDIRKTIYDKKEDKNPDLLKKILNKDKQFTKSFFIKKEMVKEIQTKDGNEGKGNNLCITIYYSQGNSDPIREYILTEREISNIEKLELTIINYNIFIKNLCENFKKEIDSLKERVVSLEIKGNEEEVPDLEDVE